jgi:hypothetical protein
MMTTFFPFKAEATGVEHTSIEEVGRNPPRFQNKSIFPKLEDAVVQRHL